MEKRLLFLYCVMVTIAMVLVLRVYSISFSTDLTQAAASQSSYTLKVAETRGAIYDCNGQRLTETESQIKAAISPSAEAIDAVAKQVSGSQRTVLLEQLRQEKPFLCNLDHPLYGEGINSFRVYDRYSSRPIAPHVLGHLDYEGKGVNGIEGAFEEELAAVGEELKLRYGVDIQQKPLEAVEAEIIGSAKAVEAGLFLTLDKDVQALCQVIGGQMLEKGAIVVMDANSGELKAVCSFPEYNPNSIEESLNDERLPFLNRAFSAWNVGSSFKLAVAAAALEQGISPDFSVDCVGGVEIAGRMVYCHHRAGHRNTDMERALEQSCNPYFIRLGREVGARAILSMAENMGFGQGSSFAEGVVSSAGNLPTLRESSGPLALANLSFGQGELLATPVQVAAMISSIANGGYRVEPQLILGWSDDGSLPQQEERGRQRIFSQSTAKQLQHFMCEVVDEGSGTNAKPSNGRAGGKTASAQTGFYDKTGEEIVHAWFSGFYETEENCYSIVVLAEGMESGGKYAAPVFQRICEQLHVLEEERQ